MESTEKSAVQNETGKSEVETESEYLIHNFRYEADVLVKKVEAFKESVCLSSDQLESKTKFMDYINSMQEKTDKLPVVAQFKDIKDEAAEAMRDVISLYKEIEANINIFERNLKHLYEHAEEAADRTAKNEIFSEINNAVSGGEAESAKATV